MQRLATLALAAALAAEPACAHRQLTDREVASAVVITAGVVGMAFILGAQSNCDFYPQCSAHMHE